MAARKPHIKVKRSKKNGEWFWSLQSMNGKKVFCGGETFKRKFTEANRQRLIKLLQEADIIYDTPRSTKRVR